MANDFASTVRGKYRELQREPDEKVLIEQGLIDSDGDLRKEGRFAIAQWLFENNEDVKAYLVTMAKAVSESEKKKKD